jgi:hypothetical protein
VRVQLQRVRPVSGRVFPDPAEERAGRAERATKDARRKRDDAYKQGVAEGYYEVLSTMVNQAGAFEIPVDELALEGFDP